MQNLLSNSFATCPIYDISFAGGKLPSRRVRLRDIYGLEVVEGHGRFSKLKICDTHTISLSLSYTCTHDELMVPVERIDESLINHM